MRRAKGRPRNCRDTSGLIPGRPGRGPSSPESEAGKPNAYHGFRDPRRGGQAIRRSGAPPVVPAPEVSPATPEPCPLPFGRLAMLAPKVGRQSETHSGRQQMANAGEGEVPGCTACMSRLPCEVPGGRPGGAACSRSRLEPNLPVKNPGFCRMPEHAGQAVLGRHLRRRPRRAIARESLRGRDAPTSRRLG